MQCFLLFTPIFWFIQSLQCPTHHQKPFSKVHLPPTSAPNAHPLFFVFCLHLITRICKNIKNSLMHLRDKILLGERLLIETMKDELKNIVQIEHTRHRSIGGFAVNLMAAMAA